MVGRGEFMDIHEAWVKGKSISEIARVTGRDRKTIRRLLRSGAQAERKPRQVTSKLDRFREYLLARMLGEDPVTNAEVLFDEIREQGYDGGRSILKEFMAPLREVAAHKTTERFETRPGQQAQVDWGMFKKPGRKRVQGFVMTLGWSRTMYLDFTVDVVTVRHRLHAGRDLHRAAGQALRHKATLVTANSSEFARVRGLRLQDWAAPGR